MFIPNKLIKHINSSNDKLIFLNDHGEPIGALMSYASLDNIINPSQEQNQTHKKTLLRGQMQNAKKGLTNNEFLDTLNSEISKQKEMENPIDLEQDYVGKNKWRIDDDIDENDDKWNDIKNENELDEDEPLYFETIQ